MSTPNEKRALRRAIGMRPTMKAFADELGVPYQTVQQWLKNGIPADYCPSIERLTDRKVSCEVLRESTDWAYVRSNSATPTP